MILTLFFVVITCAALYRRPDWVAGLLLAALVLATVLGWVTPATRLVGVAALIEALLSIGLLFVWTIYHSQRARLVGSIALMKGAWCVLMASNGMDWLTFAIVHNSAFVVQVIIAGGCADGLVAFIDRIDPFAVRQRGGRVDQLG